MFWNKKLLLAYLSASAGAPSSHAQELNYQKLGNCGVPKVQANLNVFENAIDNVNDIHYRKRRASINYAADDGERVIQTRLRRSPSMFNVQTNQKDEEEEEEDEVPKMDINFQARIVGGQAAADNSWPWQAHLSVCGKWYGVLECNICGGSLVHPRWIISAAHCVPVEPSGTIILGAHKISQGGTQRIPVKQFLTHENWNYPAMFDNDLSLLELSNLAVMSDHVSPVCIAHENTCFSPQTPCVVTGWGLTSETGGFPDELQEVAVRIISEQKCKTFQGYAPTITENMLCAGFDGGQMDACAGDSGGPLVCPIPSGKGSGWVLYGVVSWGYGCARPNSPGVYTRMTNMGAWIKEVTGLEADDTLDFSDISGSCSQWEEGFESNFQQDYKNNYANETHVWGVALNQIEWTEGHQGDNDNSQHIITETCDYALTNDDGRNVFDSDHFATTDNGMFSIHSENYPNNYRPNSDCNWVIKNTNPEMFITVTIPKGIRFDCRDRLWIKRENSREINLCRTKKSITLIDPSEIDIRFVSNDQYEGSGFAAYFQYKKLTFMCEGESIIILRKANKSQGRSAQPTVIKSENYPRPYSDFSQCRWHITAEDGNNIGLFLKAFKTERANGRCSQNHDNLLVFDAEDCETETLQNAPVWGSVCGMKPNNRLRYNTGLSKICLAFLADGDGKRGKGFQIQVNRLDGRNKVVPSFNAN